MDQPKHSPTLRVKCGSCGSTWLEPKPEANAFNIAILFFFQIWAYPCLILATVVAYSFIWFDKETSHFLARVGLTWVVTGWLPSLLLGRLKYNKSYKEELASEMCDALAEDTAKQPAEGGYTRRPGRKF